LPALRALRAVGHALGHALGLTAPALVMLVSFEVGFKSTPTAFLWYPHPPAVALDLAIQAAGLISVPVTDAVARYRIGFRGEDGRVIAHVDKRQ